MQPNQLLRFLMTILKICLQNAAYARKDKTAGFCPKCGKPVLQSDVFCPSCGKYIEIILTVSLKLVLSTSTRNIFGWLSRKRKGSFMKFRLSILVILLSLSLAACSLAEDITPPAVYFSPTSIVDDRPSLTRRRNLLRQPTDLTANLQNQSLQPLISTPGCIQRRDHPL